jgi:hypothetical protein
MRGFLIAFVWMNIGVAWALHMGTGTATFWERILIQAHIILWPLSMLFQISGRLYFHFKRTKLQPNKEKKSRAKTGADNVE